MCAGRGCSWGAFSRFETTVSESKNGGILYRPWRRRIPREPRVLVASSHVIRITSCQPRFSLIWVRILNSEALHERYWEVPGLLCSVVGCGTDWQQETRSSVFFLSSLKNLQDSLKTLPPAVSQRRRPSVIFATCGCTGILFVSDFNGHHYALPHRYFLADSVSLVDRTNLLRCWSSTDLHASVANRGVARQAQQEKGEKRTAITG